VYQNLPAAIKQREEPCLRKADVQSCSQTSWLAVSYTQLNGRPIIPWGWISVTTSYIVPS